ncbi:MAG: hypothetical protein M3Q19_15260 [Pseudomonadota bacterium]|nr:hypothetical protein [Pseudomonadota bacterium]
MRVKSLCLGAGALGLIVAPVGTASAQSAEKPGSAYVQCDGQPNNVTGGETAARLIGAVTLLGVFAPPPESADASKRKFGAAGVAACSSLLTGDKQEGNAARRIGLILGRAIHQIEAKNYQAALDDVALARREAEAANLMQDFHFVRSRGRAFDQVESAALLRMGKMAEAQAASLRNTASIEYSLLSLATTPTYEDLISAPSETEDRFNQWRARLAPTFAANRAVRLELANRFSESARIWDAIAEADAENTPDVMSSSVLARAAVAHALAGEVDLAAAQAKAAQANAAKRKADGKPETDASNFVELMDLYNILETARVGDLKTARRLFSARSQWVGASLGSVLEVNRRLRQGAAPDELIGGLSKESSQLWDEQAEVAKAAILAKDSDNKALFALIPYPRTAGAYTAQSKAIWRTDKSRLIIKLKPDETKSKMELMFLPMVDPAVAMDAYVMHAALIARSRGHEGFIFQPIVSDKLLAASFRTGKKGDKGLPAELFVNASDAITKLEPIFPSPEALKAPQARR